MTAFTATILGDNRAASGLMHAVAEKPEVRISWGELEVRAPFQQTDRSVA